MKNISATRATLILLALSLGACGQHADEEHVAEEGTATPGAEHVATPATSIHADAVANEAYLQFVGDEFEKGYLGGRLTNVQVLMAENNELELEADSLDAVMLVLSFHDLFYAAPDNGWPAIDVPAFLAELHSGLRTGGIVGIIDHYAADGSPSDTGGTTHRIDPAIVVAAMTAAGFELDRQSDILRNSEDDYDKVVFDPELRGKTDRFLMRFRKPE